jgi:hypothetical protein
MKNEKTYQAAFTQSREKIARLAPDEIARRSLYRYDATSQCFEIASLGQSFSVSYPDANITWANAEQAVPMDWALVLLNYLSSAKEMPIAGEWTTYRQLPSGQVFYGNLERYTLKELGAWYARCDADQLRAALSKMHCRLVNASADLNIQIDFTPRVPVLLQFWDGDEDMPASSQILFDRTAAEQIHIEDLAVVCGIVKRWVMRAYSSLD